MAITGSRKNAAPSPSAPPMPPKAAWLKPRSFGGNQRATPPAIDTYATALAAPAAPRQNRSACSDWLVANPAVVAAMRRIPNVVTARLPNLSEATPQGIWDSAYG